jgi:hypothetical protein
MGVDISGRKPKSELGDSFHSNWWGWRPINTICQLAAYRSKLRINFDYWGSNDGKGLTTQKQCDRLAQAIEDLLGEDVNLKEDNDRIYLCLGSWCEFGSGKFISSEIEQSLNEQYPMGTILYTSIISADGTAVESSHSTSVGRVKEFVEFLKNCGGFQIW